MYERLRSMEQETSSRQRRVGRTSLTLKLRLAGLSMLAEGVYEIRHTLIYSLRVVKGKLRSNIKEPASDPLPEIPTNINNVKKQKIPPFSKILEDFKTWNMSRNSEIYTHIIGFLQYLASLRLDVGFAEKNGKYSHAFVFQTVLNPPQTLASKKKKRKSRKTDTLDVNNATDEELIVEFASIGLKSPLGTDRDCIAKGGRYDDLVLRFKLPGDSVELPVAVGVRFALDKISSTLMSILQQQNSGSKRLKFLTRTCDVLVCTPSGVGVTEPMHEKIAVASRLWAHNVRTEYVHPTPATHEELNEHCQRHGIPVLVVLNSSITTEKDVVQLRCIDPSIPSLDVELDALSREVSVMLSTYVNNNMRQQFAQTQSPVPGKAGLIQQGSRLNSGSTMMAFPQSKETKSIDTVKNDFRIVEIEESDSLAGNTEEGIRSQVLQSVPAFVANDSNHMIVFVTRLEAACMREIVAAVDYSASDVKTAVDSVCSERLGEKARSVKSAIRKTIQQLRITNVDKIVRYLVVYSTSSKRSDFCTISS
eukprot:gb/GECG01012917.1/.p1 GENE.gb/GECG01012917.1/~~gb/GECG01012917.1/.p1  ORF type:complete len:534 (+),score=67.01 gb/GECG01012917.1/:1-1602(+)